MQNYYKNTEYIYRLLNVKGIGPAKVHAIWRASEGRSCGLEGPLNDKTFVSKLLNSEQVMQLQKNEDITSEVFSRLKQENVQIINFFEEDYPIRLKSILGDKAPLLLTFAGNRSLLDKKSVGFCGSRKASPKGVATASDCADQLSRYGINVNSGYATGIDMTTHRAALESGGTTTIVLPEGIFNFRIKKQIEDVWNWEKVCVVSEFFPGLPWSVRNAMQRNTTICALSQIMILIEAGATGGSIEAGKTSLNLNIPLLAPIYEGMPESAVGNRQLLDQGAFRIHKSKNTGRAKLDAVFDYLARRSEIRYDYSPQEAQMVREQDQLNLFAGDK
jgi:DNA processing protein